jgi:hypothetical protein
MDEGVHGPDLVEKGLPQFLPPLRGAGEASHVDIFNRSLRELLGTVESGEQGKPGFRHLDHGEVGAALGRRELCNLDVAAGEGVEDGGLAAARKSYNA